MPRNAFKLKTKYCEKYTMNGVCPFGDNCHFVHPNPRDPIMQELSYLRQVRLLYL